MYFYSVPYPCKAVGHNRRLLNNVLFSAAQLSWKTLLLPTLKNCFPVSLFVCRTFFSLSLYLVKSPLLIRGRWKVAKPAEIPLFDHGQEFIVPSTGCLAFCVFLIFRCTNCSITFGSIPTKRYTFFSFTLLPRFMIYRHTDKWKCHGNASALPLIQEIYCNLSTCKSCSGLFSP